jgi:hypothetical protein
MTRKTETIEQLDASIKKWKTRVKRAMTALDKLEKKRKRLVTKAAVAAAIDPMIAALKPGPITIEVTRQPATEKVAVLEPDNTVKPSPGFMELSGTGNNLDIPDFLRRGQAAQKAVDQVIATEKLREEIAATKKAKAAGRIAKMKAKKAGDLKKMPLSGKAALDAIRNG